MWCSGILCSGILCFVFWNTICGVLQYGHSTAGEVQMLQIPLTHNHGADLMVKLWEKLHGGDEDQIERKVRNLSPWATAKKIVREALCKVHFRMTVLLVRYFFCCVTDFGFAVTLRAELSSAPVCETVHSCVCACACVRFCGQESRRLLDRLCMRVCVCL